MSEEEVRESIEELVPGPAVGAEMTQETRPCPVCGETIKATARKCIKCDEYFDKDKLGFKDKTAWEWLNLFIIPTVLAFGGLWFADFQDRRQEERDVARAEQQRLIEADRAKSNSLQAYINDMSQILLSEDLKDDKAIVAVRARTISLLHELDATRNRRVIRFLREAELTNRIFVAAQLPGVDLSGADLRKANMRLANLAKANLRSVDLTEANLSAADLGGANLDHASLASSDLRRARLSRVTLYEGSLWGADLRHASLYQADLYNVYLNKANLKGADLRQANLTSAIVDDETQLDRKWDFVRRVSSNEVDTQKLRGVDLSEAGMPGVGLYKADLRDANLEFAVLCGGILRGANLEGANLHNANLEDADLRQANLTGANLSSAIYNAATKWPSSHDESVLVAANTIIREEQVQSPEICRAYRERFSSR